MSRKIMFVASLLVAALGTLYGGAYQYYELREYQENAVQVTAYLQGLGDQPNSVSNIGGINRYSHTIQYTVAGEDILRAPFFSKGQSDILVRDREIEITVLSNRPGRLILSDDEFSNGFVLLALGTMLLAVAIYAWRLLRKENES